MYNTLFSFLVLLILTCSVITLNAASQEPFVFSAEEERIKNELIDAFAQAGTDSVKVSDASAKFESARVEALNGNQYALLDWILFDSAKSISCARSEYFTAALEVSLVHLINNNQHNPLSLIINKRWGVISGTLFPRDEAIDVYEFLVKKGAILNFILEMHKSKTAFMLEDTLLIADLLTLKHLTFGGAYAEGAIFQKSPGFNGSEFINRLKLNFELSTFKRLNEHFKSKVWAGHVSYSTEKVDPQSDSHTEIIYGECLLQGDVLGDLTEIQGPAECGNDSKITYAFRKPKNVQMSSVVVQIYGGWTKDIAEAPNIINSLSDSSIGIFNLSLPDCVSDVFQDEQLKSENFTKTHARYMRIASDFIKRIKDTYPDLPVFLKGSSFGGFFVSSYALLQSIGLNSAEFENAYHDFVKAGFKQKFGETKLSRIDGVISCFGGTYHMDEIVNKERWSQYLTIPSFYHFNFDDDRIEFSSAVEAVLPPKDNYGPFVSLSVKRRAVEGFLIGIASLDASDKEDVQLIFKDACAGKTSLLGHSSFGDKYFDEQVVHFVLSSKAVTPLRLARQKRLFEMYENERQRFFKLSDFSAKDLYCDLTQFLRNLKKMKEEEEESASFTDDERSDKAMYLVFENSGELLKTFVFTYFGEELGEVNNILSRYEQDMYDLKSGNFLLESNRLKYQGFMEGMLSDFKLKFLSWEGLYDGFSRTKMRRYHDDLKKFATINRLWGEDITEEESLRRLSFIRSKDDDIQQFLSNLRNTQRQIERDGEIGRDAVAESHMHLVNGDVDLVCFEFGKSLKDAGKIVLTKTKRFNVFSFEKEAFDVFVKEKKEALKESLSDVMPQNLQNQVLVDELTVYPGFKDFYSNAQTEYHDKLMQSVSTRGVWQEAFKAVREKNRAKRALASLH